MVLEYPGWYENSHVEAPDIATIDTNSIMICILQNKSVLQNPPLIILVRYICTVVPFGNLSTSVRSYENHSDY